MADADRRRQLLDRYLGAAAAGRPRSAEPLADRTRPLPLSPAQQRVWFLDRLRPGTAEYVVTVAWRLSGELSVPRLRTAWQALVERHEILRTTYHDRPDGPVQVVHEPTGIDFRVLPVTEDEVGATTRAEAGVPFDLAADAPLRVRLLRLADTDHVLLLVVHHIAYDGWSTAVVARELAAHYRGTALPPPPLQYADVAVRQRRRANGPVVAAQLAHWRTRLAGAPVLELPTDRPRPAVHDSRGDIVLFTVDADVTARLKALAHDRGATPFMVLLAAFQILLARYSGQSDICVGSPVAGRGRPGTRDLVGLFLNTVVLRATIDAARSFPDLVDDVRRDVLAALDNQEAPFERLADELVPGRDLSRNPLFQAMFVLQNVASAGFTAGAVRAEPRHSPWVSAKFDLTLELTEQSDGTLAGVLDYPVSLFDRSTVTTMARAFGTLLHGIATASTARVADLPLAHPGSDGAGPFAPPTAYPGGTLVDLVAEGLGGDTAAVVADGARIDAPRLDAWSNQAARRLRALGVGPESVVGIRLERGPELVVALLGVLKAGGAYLPLDPDLPAERLAFMVEDAGARVVLTPGDLTGLDEPDTPLDRSARPEHAAYVIYTSGSTGRPKAVVIEHRAIVNRLRWMQDTYRLLPTDRVLQKTPSGFDVSVWEFFWPLAAGATLVLARPGGHREPAYLAEVMVDAGITTAHFVPSMLRSFLDQPLPPLPLRQVMCSGEALPDDLVTAFAGRVGCALHNLYGPTEAAIDVTATPCRAGQEVTIGRPVANTRVHVLDGNLLPQPDGAAGELAIAGVQLARGYLGRGGLTADRFVPDPFAARPGERLYRTGDRGRRRPDGTIAYLGRVDDQLKLHGVRIEPGEVESVLRTHPGVRAAAVAVRDDRLVGYVVLTTPAPDPGELRDHLGAALPGPMLPTRWVVLDALPTTSSGKIDRAALPNPAPEAPDRCTPPGTAAERAVAEVFATTVGVPAVGRDDSFFEIGGDSLRAIRAVGMLRDRGLDVSVQDLFRRPRVGELAASAAAGPAAAPVASTRPFALLTATERSRLPPDVTDAYPLTLAQAAMVHQMLNDPEHGLYLNHLGYPVRDDGAFAPTALRAATARLVARHEILRTSIDLADGARPVQRVHRTAVVEVGHTDLRGLPSAEQRAAVRRHRAGDLTRGFELRTPGLLRLHAHRLGDRDWRLAFGYVHAILDGWSQNSLVAELLADYRALRGGAEPVAAAPPSVRFADAVAAEQEALDSDADRAFWAARVAAADRFRVPAGWAGRDDGAYRTVRVPFADRSADLRRIAADAGVPLKSLLLAVHLCVLHTVADSAPRAQDRPEGPAVLHSGLVTHVRPEHAEADLVRGMFLNTVPFGVPWTASTWPDLARAVLATEVALWPHRRFPLPAMQAAWGGPVPLVDVFFNHTDMHVLDGHVDPAAVEDSTPNEFSLSVSTVPDAIVLEAFTRRVDVAHLDLLARTYRHVLDDVCRDPGADPRRVGLPDPDRRAALAAGTSVRTGARPATLPEMFRAGVAAGPGAVAVVCAGVELTYAELDARVDRCAGRLLACGVRPGEAVGVLLARGADMLVALLAVHRAGAAYVPVDPRHPAPRIAYVLADSGAVAVVTGTRGVPELALPTVQVDGAVDGQVDGQVEVCCDGADPTWPVPDPRDPAYIIYTSGSTGRPKGVLIEHGALGNFLTSMRERPGLAPGSVVLAATTVSFDIAALELYLPLITGGRVVIATDDECADPARLVALMHRTATTTVQATPSALRLLVDAGWVPPAGTTVLAGGEKLPTDLARALVAGGAALWDLYGPTETTVWSTVTRIGPDAAATGWWPVAETDVHVLDGRGEPSPAMVLGEVHIGGTGLARGYVGRPGLTADRFVPDPHASVPGSRLYRTGDLARRHPDGRVEIAGRVDHQVKIRGHRVEPGEVEAALTTDPRVAAAVVVATTTATGAELTAYVVPAPGSAVTASDVRGALGTRVPAHLVPGRVVLLAALPLTPAGKVDRAALPAPGREPRPEPVPPRTADERCVAAVWAGVLGIDPAVDAIGRDDDFFDRGGHSVLATRIALRLRAESGKAVPVRAVFDHPTVGALAAALPGYAPETDDPRTAGTGLLAVAAARRSRSGSR